MVVAQPVTVISASPSTSKFCRIIILFPKTFRLSSEKQHFRFEARTEASLQESAFDLLNFNDWDDFPDFSDYAALGRL